jgi:uncharacterized protein with HEPN domain
MPRDETYLLYMLIASRRIVRYLTGVTREQFDANDEKMDSVVLQLGNIGEAAGKVSSDYQRLHPEIPWSKMIGMRHKIFHDYMEVDWNIVWSAAAADVPNLIPFLEPLIPPEDSV